MRQFETIVTGDRAFIIVTDLTRADWFGYFFYSKRGSCELIPATSELAVSSSRPKP